MSEQIQKNQSTHSLETWGLEDEMAGLGALAVPHLVPLLTDRDPHLRSFAGNVIKRIGASAVPEILRVIKEKARAYEQEKLPHSADKLRIALIHEFDVSIFKEIEKESIPYLIGELDHPNEVVRSVVIDILVMMEEDALRAVVKGLGSRKSAAWRASAIELLRRDPKNAAPLLID